MKIHEKIKTMFPNATTHFTERWNEKVKSNVIYFVYDGFHIALPFTKSDIEYTDSETRTGSMILKAIQHQIESKVIEDILIRT